jgi:poly-gamma-glutamate synthesis protein (capsule biosynthesis protein)
MRGASWRDDPRCPRFEDLALLEIPHVDFDGEHQTGELVVAASVAGAILDVFAAIAAARFPIASMRRIDSFGGDDDRSMAANNCSGFCFREISRGSGLSQHAYGLAVDINPVQNPYISASGKILPPNGSAYLDRGDLRPGMLVRPSPVIAAFEAIGWEWGGDWTRVSDYHHFARPA